MRHERSLSRPYPTKSPTIAVTAGESILHREFPNMRSIQAFGKKVTGWQVLSVDAPDFEEATLLACELIVARDPRIGKVPGARRASVLCGPGVHDYLSFTIEKVQNPPGLRHVSQDVRAKGDLRLCSKDSHRPRLCLAHC